VEEKPKVVNITEAAPYQDAIRMVRGLLDDLENKRFGDRVELAVVVHGSEPDPVDGSYYRVFGYGSGTPPTIHTMFAIGAKIVLNTAWRCWAK
jgi:hypothetical protein